MADNVITISPTGELQLPFSDIELTRLINILPTPFGQLTQEGMFPAEGLTSQYFQLTLEDNIISVLPVTDGGPATVARHETADAYIFRVPMTEHQDDVRSGDLRGVLNLAQQSNQPATLVDWINKRLMRLRLKFNMTLEFMRTTSLTGNVLDGANNSIVNIYTALGLTQKVVYFNFSASTPSTPGNAVQIACDLLYQLITQDLSDETMDTVRVKCDRGFFNQLINCPEVKEFYLQAEQAVQLANVVRGRDGGYRPRTFTIYNVTFEEYSAIVPMWGGTSQRIIPANTGSAFAGGTFDTHVTYVAPPDDIRELDGSSASLTDLIHITTEPMKHGKGIEILGGMNALPIWRRPNLLVNCQAGNGSSTPPLGG